MNPPPLRLIAILLGVLVGFGGLGAAEPATTPDEQKELHLIGKGDLAEVHVFRTLYEIEGEKDFFIRIRVTNLTDRPIGVYLRSFWKVIYPNQVGFQPEKQRFAIDERHWNYKSLSDEEKAKLVAYFNAGSLVSIPAHGSTDYFRKFNAGDSLALAKKNSDKYFFISLDGEQLLTDGNIVEQVSCEWGKFSNLLNSIQDRSEVDTELYIPTPIKWEQIPADGQIIDEWRNRGGRKLMVMRHSDKGDESIPGKALRWLGTHQEADGHFDAQKFGAVEKSDVASTSLALLAFLGAGHTEKVGAYKDNVKRAIAWLARISHQ
jgi:hypothetical protein